ncbi:hypothetical protein ACR42D_08870 [Desulfovibrio caledoniensis]
METQIAELKAMITKLAAEVSKIKLDAADIRIHLKSTMGDVNRLSGQIQTIDKLMEAGHHKAQAKEQKATVEAENMNLTQLGQLYKQDPAKAFEVMRKRGMKTSSAFGGINPWIVINPTEQERIERLDPEHAKHLKAEAAKIRNVPTN